MRLVEERTHASETEIVLPIFFCHSICFYRFLLTTFLFVWICGNGLKVFVVKQKSLQIDTVEEQRIGMLRKLNAFKILRVRMAFSKHLIFKSLKKNICCGTYTISPSLHCNRQKFYYQSYIRI